MKPVAFEPLESRRLFALTVDVVGTDADGSPFAHLTKSGTLVLTGQLTGDTLTVETSKNGKRILAIGPGPLDGNFSAKEVKRVLVEGGGGQDKIVTNNLNKPATLVGGSGNDILQGGHRSTLIGGDGNDKLIVKSPDRFGGGATGQLVYDLNGALVTWAEIGSSPYRVSFATGPSLLSGGAGNDTFASGGSEDTVVGGPGNDSFTPTGKLAISLEPDHHIEGIGQLSSIEQVIFSVTAP
jgi:Ca2+-binding RTX toxin-like protein